jgi:hypothetical protein
MQCLVHVINESESESESEPLVVGQQGHVKINKPTCNCNRNRNGLSAVSVSATRTVGACAQTVWYHIFQLFIFNTVV